MSVNEKALLAVAEAQTLVNHQADEECLWEPTRDVRRAFLQQELRRAHEAIEKISQLVGIPAESLALRMVG